jgi:hypothetical protein
MNRIGEASGSLSNLLNPDLMQEMDLSEQALVLFFRAKILSHQGLLRQAETALLDSIQAYGQTIGMGAEDLTLEQVSAKIYLSRVRARRGRLDEALQLCLECQEQLQAMDAEEGPPSLELADANELEGWILLQLERFNEGLGACERAAQALDQIRGSEVEADIETEHSLNLVTRALLYSGLKNHGQALQLAGQAVDMEQRRAQEGYEQARMWCALHRLALAKIQRIAQKPQDALETSEQAWKDLEALPANQKNHLGLHMAAVQTEIALAHVQLEQWNLVRQPLRLACSQYENEMWQGKEYLIAVLLDCQRYWLDFCRLSANSDWQDRSCWKQFFEGWARWQSQIQEEAENVFLQQAQQRLRRWLQELPGPVQTEWNETAPLGLRMGTPARD